MPKTVSSLTITETAKRITRPGHLVQIEMTTIYRFSSRGDVTWNGFLWASNNVKPSGLREMPSGGAAMTVQVGNTDRAMGAAVLNERPQGKLVTVWAYYEGAVASADPLLLFQGAIDDTDIGLDWVTFNLTQMNDDTLFLPKNRITPATGFTRLSAAGRIIEFGNMKIELVRGRQ